MSGRERDPTLSRAARRSLLFSLALAGPIAAMHAPAGMRWALCVAGLVCMTAFTGSWVAELAGLIRSAARDEKRSRRILLLTSFLVCYLLVEGGATIVAGLPGWGDRLGAFSARYLFENPPLLVAHPFLLLTNNPAREGVNALGFIGDEYQERKPAGVYRIACLGGSTTQDGYVKRLERRLAGRFPDRRIEVLNFGNPAWTTTQILFNYLLNVRAYSPDLLIVLTGANEIKVRGFPEFRADYAHAFGVLTRPEPRRDAALVAGWNAYALFRWLAFKRSGREPGIELTDVIQRPGGLSRPLRPEELFPLARNLRDLVAAARREGTAVAFASEPFSRARLQWGGAKWIEHMEEVGRLIRRLAAEEGVLFIDLDSAITGHEEMFVDPIHLAANTGVPLKVELIASALTSRLSQGAR